LNRKAGGGALYDMGCYLIQFAILFMDALPDTIIAHAVIQYEVDVGKFSWQDLCFHFSGASRAYIQRLIFL
jgi:predicted dehydrogenase